LRDLEKVRKLIGEHPVVVLTYARMQAASGDINAALESMRNVQGPLLVFPSILLEYARMLAARNEYDQAFARVMFMHRLYGPSRGSLLLLSSLPERHQEVTQATQRALEFFGKEDPELLEAAADLALRTGDAEKANVLYNQIAESAPVSEAAFVGPIRVALLERNFNEALALIDTARIQAETAAALSGLALNGLERFVEAFDAFERAGEDQPVGVKIAHARAAIATQQWAEAESLLQSLDPTIQSSDPSVATLLASTYVRTGKAQPLVEVVNAAFPQANDEAQRAALLSMKALGLVRMGRVDGALDAAQSALGYLPDLEPAQRLLAGLYAEVGRHEKARELLQKLHERFPDDIPLLIALARSEALLGHIDLARRMLVRARETYPQDDALPLAAFRMAGSVGDFVAAQTIIDQRSAHISMEQKARMESSLARWQGDTMQAASKLQPFVEKAPFALEWAILSLDNDDQDEAAIVAVLDPHQYSRQAYVRLAVVAEQRQRWQVARVFFPMISR
jgi:tetratricopeptide (TPR) repeat protein